MKSDFFKRLGALTVAIAAVVPIPVLASTAANTQITNTVRVDYANADSSQTYFDESSVTIEVDLVPSAPIVTAPGDIDPITENTATSLTYTVTATSNGPDTYDLTGTSTDNSLSAPGITGSSLMLGATTVAVDVSAAATTITVPYDGDNSGPVSINGIEDGDTIVINPGNPTSETVSVVGVSENPGNNTATITIDAGGSGLANSYTVGMIIGEQFTTDLDVTTGNISSGPFGTHTITGNVASQTDAAANSDNSNSDTVIYVRRPTLTVTKYVRNATSGTAGSGTVITVNGENYYPSGVTGDPGDTMEYLIVVDNSDSNAGVATDIVISDGIPQFTSYLGNIQVASVTSQADGWTGTWATPDDGLDTGDAAEFDNAGTPADSSDDVVYVYGGAGGTDIGDNGGDLNPTEFSLATFQVTIDN